MRVGIVGCGNISDIYIINSQLFKDVEITCCADVVAAAASRTSDKYGLRNLSVNELVETDDIDIVLNLTSPKAHAEISDRAIRAGKHVYTEKPLATSLEEGITLMQKADAQGVRVGSAPDTILGGGLQTAKELIDGGVTGKIVTGISATMHKGAEHWHPNPAFLYQKGTGPVLDLGPYYIAALTALLGPVASIRAAGFIAPWERSYGAEGPLKGQIIEVETYTTVHAILTFTSGAVVSFIASWDVWNHGVRNIELHGALASIRVPDPDTFGGAVEVSNNKRLLNVHNAADLEELSRLHERWTLTDSGDRIFGTTNYPFDRPSYANYRSVGLAEMANAIVEDRPHRCSGRFALHALAVMTGMLNSADTGEPVEVAVDGDTPAPFTREDERRLLRNVEFPCRSPAPGSLQAGL
jgi:predicted dehydrogenase